MLKNKTLLQYLLIIFLLGIVFFCYMMLKDLNISKVEEETDAIPREVSYSHELENALTFMRNNQYQLALKLLENLSRIDLNNKQRYAVSIMMAQCHKSLGLYNTSIEYVEKALESRKEPFAWYLLGTIYEQMENEKDALNAFENAINADKFYYFAHEKIGDVHFKSGNYIRALKYYQPKSQKRSFISDSAILKIALCHFYMGDTEQSLKFCDKYLDTSKRRLYTDMAYFVKAVCLTSQNEDFNETEKLYKTAISRGNPRTRNIYKYYYSLYLIKHDLYKQAIKVLLEIDFGDSVKNPHVNKTLGQIYLLNQDFDKSVKFFDKNVTYSTDLKDVYFYGVCLYKLGRYSPALEQFKRILKKENKDEYALSASVLAALAFAKTGNVSESHRLMDQAIDVWGEHPILINTLAYIVLNYSPELFYNRLSRYFNQEKYRQLNLFLADYYNKNGQFGPALVAVLDYMQQNEPTPRLVKVCGDLHLSLKEYDSATEYYNRAFDMTKTVNGKVEILNNLAYTAHQQENYNASMEHMQKAALMQSRNPGLYYNLAVLYNSRSDYDNYRDSLEKSLSYLDDYDEDRKLKSDILLEAGLDALLNGNKGRARKYFRRSLRSNPDNNTAEYNLRQLD